MWICLPLHNLAELVISQEGYPDETELTLLLVDEERDDRVQPSVPGSGRAKLMFSRSPSRNCCPVSCRNTIHMGHRS